MRRVYRPAPWHGSKHSGDSNTKHGVPVRAIGVSVGLWDLQRPTRRGYQAVRIGGDWCDCQGSQTISGD